MVVVRNGINDNVFRAEGNFKWRQENLDREVSEGTYFLIKTKQFSPRFQKAKKATKVPSNIIDDEVGVGTNEDAQKEIVGIGVDFSYAKPSSLVGFLIKMPFWTDKDITILDFFAGSGTTLHATMQLNAEDGGHRQCILVTNNENGICENVTYERNRRVIQGYTTPKGEEVPGLTRNNLRYYKTKFVPRDKSPKNLHRLMELSTDMLCIHNDAYTEKPFAGKRINNKIARYFESNDGNKRMLVVYLAEAVQAIVELIKQEISKEEMSKNADAGRKNDKLMVYVFSPNGYAYDDEFEEVSDYVTLCAMPDAVLNAYRRVLPKRKPQYLQEYLDSLESETDESGAKASEHREADLFDFNNHDEIGMAASEIHESREEMKHNHQNTEEGGEA